MNNSIGIDNKERPFRSPVIWPVHTVKPRHLSLGFEIRQERKMQLPVAAERGMALRAVNRDAKKLRAEFLKLRKHLVVESHLVAADWTPVSGIKGEHDWSSPKLIQFYGLIRRALKSEVWGRRSCRQRG